MPDEQAARIQIYGKVQGIGFRIFALKNANDFAISGFVRNEPDGSLTIEGQGDPKMLKRFIESCKHGPELARIDRFIVEDMPPKRVYTFSVIED